MLQKTLLLPKDQQDKLATHLQMETRWEQESESMGHGQAQLEKILPMEPLEAIVIALVVDAGVPSRGHRTNIFSTSFKIMGSYTGTHKTYRSETCIDYAGGLVSNGKYALTPAAAGDNQCNLKSGQNREYDAYCNNNRNSESGCSTYSAYCVWSPIPIDEQGGYSCHLRTG